MSSLFSIGEDELDIDDEDCLLAACGIGNSSSYDSSNQSSFKAPKDAEKLNGNTRKPFGSIGNITTRSSSVARAGFPGGIVSKSTAKEFEIGVPLAKRFAVDKNISNGSHVSKPSNTITCNTMSSAAVCHSTFKTPSPNPTPFQGNPAVRHSQLQKFTTYEQPLAERPFQLGVQTTPQLFRPTSSFASRTATDTRNKNSTSTFPITDSPCRSDNSTSHPISSNEAQFLQVSRSPSNLDSVINSTSVCNNTATIRQRPGSTWSSVASSRGKDSPLHVSTPRTSALPLNQKTHTDVTAFNKNCTSFRDTGATQAFRKSTPVSMGNLRAQQAVTPVSANRSLVRTPGNGGTPRSMRKFPGPAGLLPKLNPGQNLDDTSLTSPLQVIRRDSPVQTKVSSSSPSEDEDFNRDPWSHMYQDFVKNVPLTMRYTIVRVYSEAIQQRLDRGKVPSLCALIKTFSLTQADASVLLKDPTGEIHGTLHRKVLEDYQSELAAGAGLILKHVSVFSPSPRKHYLNITPGNILQIYPPDPQYVSSSQALASQCTQQDAARKEARDDVEAESIAKETDVELSVMVETTSATEQEPWMQQDCFDDLLQGLDDDDDFFDEALLV